jgi:hypothetical protein
MTSLVVRVPLRQMYMPGAVGTPLIFGSSAKWRDKVMK